MLLDTESKMQGRYANASGSTGASAMDDQPVDRLMDIILQMRINLQQVTVTFQQQTQEIRDQLEAIFEEEGKALDGCLNGIDDRLKECAAYIENYKRLYSSLSAMHRKLVQLGAEPGTMPNPPPTEQVEGIFLWRLQQLRCEGKI
jgi:hypothetical protein